MICLCSKSYVASYQAGGKPKFSLKGVNKRSCIDPTETFEQVLTTQKTEMAINRGTNLTLTRDTRTNKPREHSFTITGKGKC